MMIVSKIAGFVWYAILLILLFDNSVSAQQAEADVLLTQATLAYDDQQYDKALQLLDRVIASEPNNARPHYYKALVLNQYSKPT